MLIFTGRSGTGNGAEYDNKHVSITQFIPCFRPVKPNVRKWQ